jgi:hypothetical protein
MLTGSPSTIGTTVLVADAVVLAVELLRSPPLLVAVDGSPPLLVTVDGSPPLLVTVDGSPPLLVAVDGSPPLLVAVDGSPPLLVLVEPVTAADPLEVVEVNPPQALRPPTRSTATNMISVALNLHPATISPVVLSAMTS